MKKTVKKAVPRARNKEAVRKINELGRHPNNVFRLVRNEFVVVGGRCMRRNYGTFYLDDMERANLS